MSKIALIIDFSIELFAKIAAFLIIALSFLVVYDSLNRYLFSGGSVALQELEWHIFDIIFLLGISYTLKNDKHVRVDIFYANFSKKRKEIVDTISLLLLVIPFSLMIIYVSFDYVALSFAQNEISPDPGGLCCRYIIKSMIILGFFLLTLSAISKVYQNIQRLKS